MHEPAPQVNIVYDVGKQDSAAMRKMVSRALGGLACTSSERDMQRAEHELRLRQPPKEAKLFFTPQGDNGGTGGALMVFAACISVFSA